MLRVVVDEREKPSGVPDELMRLGVLVDYRVLEVADYIVGEYAIERKSVRDFISSLFSGRLFDQAFRLGEAYQTTILVVEGDLEVELNKLKNPRSLWGALISAVLDFRLACFYTRNQEQTAEFILTLGKGGRFRGRSRGPPLVVRKPKTEDMKRIQTSIVSSLPNVGPRVAEQLLSNFGSVRKVFAASVTDMAVGAGIGKARALTLNRILDTPYKASKGQESQAQLR
jgi:DNA excision repair protein ERCC-4